MSAAEDAHSIERRRWGFVSEPLPPYTEQTPEERAADFAATLREAVKRMLIDAAMSNVVVYGKPKARIQRSIESATMWVTVDIEAVLQADLEALRTALTVDVKVFGKPGEEDDYGLLWFLRRGYRPTRCESCGLRWFALPRGRCPRCGTHNGARMGLVPVGQRRSTMVTIHTSGVEGARERGREDAALYLARGRQQERRQG